MKEEYKPLIGLNIYQAVLEKDRKQLTLRSDCLKTVRFKVCGGCCSNTWIESLDNELALIGTIFNVEDIEMPNYGNVGTPYCPSVEFVQYYGLRITTNNGICVIDYRNSSNGYYGGSVYVEITDSFQ